jgi:hypothetical protein
MRKALLAILVIAIVGGMVAVVFTSRPALDDARKETETAWAPLVEPLDARYAQLTALVSQLETVVAATGVQNENIPALKGSIAQWDEVADGDDAQDQVEAANAVEARVGQVRMVVLSSASLGQVAPIQQALAAFDAAQPPAEDVAAYNEAVRKYQRTREEALRRPVAGLLGYGAIPTFEPAPAAS